MHCNLRDELTVDYSLALDQVTDARRAEDWAVTVTQIECAATRLRRVKDHRLSVIRELLAHCEQHGCGTEETRRIFATTLYSSCVGAAR
jgi:hypothetical protein